MVSVTQRKKGRQGYYYYLTHKTTVRQYEKYLGKAVPENIEAVKKEFEEGIFRKEKLPLIERVRKGYMHHTRSTDPKILKSEHHGFKITYTYSTQRIEGSTMTLGQTKRLLEHRLSPKDTATEDIIEAEQIAAIFDEMLTAKKDISQDLILRWHEKLFERTDTNNAGSFRREDVAPYMGKTEYDLWADVVPDMELLIEWYGKNKKTMNAVELSSRFHRRFELIHPFVDGNGRIGRMCMLSILHKNNYPMLNILPKEKDTYVKKLEASYLQHNGFVFVKWFILKYLRDHKKYLG